MLPDYDDLQEDDPRMWCRECFGIEGEHRPGCPYATDDESNATDDKTEE